ncbi:MAG TPA: COR domain-containing protein [Anaerolineales bacterium]|nr:COR domain-containing protein [Anaerolineales bacterium]
MTLETALSRIRRAAESGATELDLFGLGLTSLPPEIGNLTRLTKLDLWVNQLTSLPPEIGNLTSLTELNLVSNQLTSLPPEIGNLTNLTTLVFSENQLTSLPPEIGNLTSLTELNLSRNRLTSLPPEIGNLTNLTRLDLGNNQLTSLPPEMARLTRLKSLFLHGNPLALALPRALLGSEIFGGDAQAIFRFYRAIWEAGRELGEVRVLFVGQPAVGKTSLVHRLKDGSYDPNRPSTMTVETHALPFGTVTARVWDFGGQDFMHATHPFFFSARCVYVLVLNVRQTYEQNRVEYWLRTIRAFGGESPVILVGNHADATQHILDLPYNRLKREFPHITTFVQTSAAENTGIDDLRAALEEAIRSLPHVRVRFAQSHLRVKEALEREKERRDIIPYERYAELCTTEGIRDKEDQRTLLALLHDLGVVLDFRNEAGEPLSPDGVLNPNWVTDAVYRIITDQELRLSAAGRLTPEMNRRILHEYQPYHRDLILKLLQRFELAYPAPEAGVWYLPNAMPQDEPPEAADPAWTQGLTLEYAYATLPESVITRFIVRAHEHIEAGRVWRWGVILASGENRALVRANVAERRVEIHVLGQENTRRDLLAFIRGHFQAIHKTFQKSAGRENFPVQEYLCPSEYPGLRLDYQDLLIREREGEMEIRPTWQGRVLRLNIAQVLNGFISPQMRWKELHMAKEIHYHEHRHFEAKEVVGSMVNLGNENQLQQTIQGSFNSGLTSEVQTTLAQLTAAVQEMLQHLSAEQAEEVRDNLEHLEQELSKPKPNKKWYSVSIEGLIKAAENVGKIGAPVIQLARKLLQLLG